MCDFATPHHLAGYVLIDDGDEDAVRRLACDEHLAGMIQWRLSNHPAGVRVRRVEQPQMVMKRGVGRPRTRSRAQRESEPTAG